MPHVTPLDHVFLYSLCCYWQQPQLSYSYEFPFFEIFTLSVGGKIYQCWLDQCSGDIFYVVSFGNDVKPGWL
jgi:hypothetical protein